MTLGELFLAFQTFSGAHVFGAALLVALVAWRWVVMRDRQTDEKREGHADRASADVAALRAQIAALADRVAACASEDELRALEREVAALKLSIGTNLEVLRGDIKQLTAKLEGQHEILMRIDDHLRARG